MFRPKPGEKFTKAQIDQMAEAALTKSIARPRYGAWAILQLINRAARGGGSSTDSDTDERIKKLEASYKELSERFDELAAKEEAEAKESTDESKDGGADKG